MASQTSVQLLPDVPLVPQSAPVAAVDVGFCSPVPVEFQITHQSTIPSRFIVRDLASGVVCSHKERKMFSKRQILVDVRNNDCKVAVLNAMKTALSNDFSVHPGAGDAADELVEMSAKMQLKTAILRVSFVDLVTGERYLMGFEGTWRCHLGFFWLKRGLTGPQQPVAKAYETDTGLGREMYAPNVDVALVLAICMVLDERWRRFKNSHDL